MWPDQILQIPLNKDDHHQRQPQIESGIFQQPMLRSYANLKLKRRRPNQTLEMLQMKMIP